MASMLAITGLPTESGTVMRVQYGQGAIPDTVTPRTRADLAIGGSGPLSIDGLIRRKFAAHAP